MENPKRHKRSGSSSAPKQGYTLNYARKKAFLPKIHGKFQVGKARLEKKNIDTDLAAGLTNCPSLATATPLLLNTYSTGTTPNSTIGRRVTNLSVHIKANIVQSTAPSAATVVRLLVVYDRQPSGSAPSIAQIFGNTLYGVSSVMNLGFSDRFSVLMDEKQTLAGIQQSTASGLYNVYNIFVDRYVKCKLPTESSSNFGGTIATIAEGAIYLVAFSDIAAANNPPLLASGVARIRFIDN